MRENIPANAVRLDDAPCGCERYEVDGADAQGGRMRSVICLHTCEGGAASESMQESQEPAAESARQDAEPAADSSSSRSTPNTTETETSEGGLSFTASDSETTTA